MAEVPKTPPSNFTEFLWSDAEEETLFQDNGGEEIVIYSRCVFSRRKLARISQNFEVTVLRYHYDVSEPFSHDKIDF